MRVRFQLQLIVGIGGTWVSASVHACIVQYCGIRVWAAITDRQMIPHVLASKTY